MTATRPLLALALFAGLAGCISLGEDPPARLLTLAATEAAPAGPGGPVAPGTAITIMMPLVPAKLQTTRVPVQASATEIAYVKDAQWVEPPNRLFRRLLGEVIAARTGRAVLDPRQFAADPGLRLGGQLSEFGVDGEGRAAVVQFDAEAMGASGLRTRRFVARVPLGQIDGQSVGPALNRAANDLAGQVADWLKDEPGAPARP